MSITHVVCAACDFVNRVGEEADAERLCALCRRPLFGGSVASLDEGRFWRHVERSEIPLLVTIPGPSAIADDIGPVLSDIARQLEPEARVVLIHENARAKIAQRFGVPSMPACLLFEKGRVAGLREGPLTAAAPILDWVRSRQAVSTP